MRRTVIGCFKDRSLVKLITREDEKKREHERELLAMDLRERKYKESESGIPIRENLFFYSVARRVPGLANYYVSEYAAAIMPLGRASLSHHKYLSPSMRV